jgi:hypothetical protein
MKSLVFAFALVVFAAPRLSAQQLEANDSGGSFQSQGVSPLAGQPFRVPIGSTIDFTVSGNAVAPYILLTGVLATSSLQIPALNNQYVDLDINSVFVLGDAIGFSGALPAYYFVTNPAGVSDWSFPANSILDGVTLAFQAIVADPALPPLNLNLTAAGAFSISSDLFIEGDDNSGVFTIPSGPYTMYGQQFSEITICTNGWMLFGQNYSSASFQNNFDFLNGDPGYVFQPGPLVCADWHDQITEYLPFSYTRAHEDIATRTLTVQWINGAYYPNFGGPYWGNITLIIQQGGGLPIVTFDYTAFAPAPAPLARGIVGISAANLGPGSVIEQDLVTAGSFNQIAPTATGFMTWFQNFDGSGATNAEPIDVPGLIITAQDVSGNGDWFVF